MSPLEQLQRDIAGRADAHFPYVTVKTIRPRSAEEATLIQTDIDNALAGFLPKGEKSGAVILVDMPSAVVEHPDSADLEMVLVPMLRIMENPIINRGPSGTGMTAEEILFEVEALFNGFLDGGIKKTLTMSRRPFEAAPEFIKDGFVVYDVYFHRLHSGGMPAKTATPKISNAHGVVTITCTDHDAAIWYTTDGSYPSPLNPAATQVDGDDGAIGDSTGEAVGDSTGEAIGDSAANNLPSFADGTLVRAVAYATNKQASNLAAKVIDIP